MKEQKFQKFNSIYRGIVVNNLDPFYKGRIKIYVPGVHDPTYQKQQAYLPWATPAMPSFGGNAIDKISIKEDDEEKTIIKKTGYTSVPHIGAQVFVFFENGLLEYPVYFAFSQSGDDWLSQHEEQTVFQSDNVSVRIDENPGFEKSTCKSNSNTSHLNFGNSKEVGKKPQNFNTSESSPAFVKLKEKGELNDENCLSNLTNRVDITIENKSGNAINLNIIGNVNYKLSGDLYLQHYGDKYEYHKGNIYRIQDGNSYIEQNGSVQQVINGSVNRSIYGNYLLYVSKTQHYTIGEDFLNDINDLFRVNSTDSQSTQTNGHYYVTADKNIQMKTGQWFIYQANDTISGLAKTNNCFLNAGNNINSTAVNDTTIKSNKGNIRLQTLGLFNIFTEDPTMPYINAEGFNNIGLKGNISIISKVGNINIQCQKTSACSGFTQKYISIPWNPSFANKLAGTSPNSSEEIFNKSIENKQKNYLPKDTMDSTQMLKIFNELNDLSLGNIYDGFPVFLPTKMILQNPNFKSTTLDDTSWVPQFRSVYSDFTDVSQTNMWKLPGRSIGNINIKTWTGNINIRTEDEIGCAGNINIIAQQNVGSLPGYQAGSINIHSQISPTAFIYPDPRDLFFDSDYKLKLTKNIVMFSNGKDKNTVSNPNSMFEIQKNIPVTTAQNAAKAAFGYEFKFMSKDYSSKEYTSRSGEKIIPILGCAKCLTDYVLGVNSVRKALYQVQNQKDFGSVSGIHTYGFNKINPLNKNATLGTFNPEAKDYIYISRGLGHAIDNGWCSYNSISTRYLGSINIESHGGLYEYINGNYELITSISVPKCQKVISHFTQVKYNDDNWPKELLALILPTINTRASLLSTKLSVENGVFTTGSEKDKTKQMMYDTGNRAIKNLHFEYNDELVSGYTTKFQNSIGSSLYDITEIISESGIYYGAPLSSALNLLTGAIPQKHENESINIKDETLKVIATISSENSIKNNYLMNYVRTNIKQNQDSSYWFTKQAGDKCKIQIGILPEIVPTHIEAYSWYQNDSFQDKEFKKIDDHRNLFDFYLSSNLQLYPEIKYITSYIDQTKLGPKLLLQNAYEWKKFYYEDKVDDKSKEKDILKGPMTYPKINSQAIASITSGHVIGPYIKNQIISAGYCSGFTDLDISNGDLYRINDFNVSNGNIFTSSYLSALNSIENSQKNYSNGKNINSKLYCSPINRNITILSADSVYLHHDDKKSVTVQYSENILSTLLVGNQKTTKKADDREGINNIIVFEQKDFVNNKFLIKNGCSEKSSNGYNTINIFNGTKVGSQPGPTSVKNQFMIDNGANGTFSGKGTNDLILKNGTTLTKNAISIYNTAGGESGNEVIELSYSDSKDKPSQITIKSVNSIDERSNNLKFIGSENLKIECGNGVVSKMTFTPVLIETATTKQSFMSTLGINLSTKQLGFALPEGFNGDFVLQYPSITLKADKKITLDSKSIFINSAEATVINTTGDFTVNSALGITLKSVDTIIFNSIKSSIEVDGPFRATGVFIGQFKGTTLSTLGSSYSSIIRSDEVGLKSGFQLLFTFENVQYAFIPGFKLIGTQNCVFLIGTKINTTPVSSMKLVNKNSTVGITKVFQSVSPKISSMKISNTKKLFGTTKVYCADGTIMDSIRLSVQAVKRKIQVIKNTTQAIENWVEQKTNIIKYINELQSIKAYIQSTQVIQFAKQINEEYVKPIQKEIDSLSEQCSTLIVSQTAKQQADLQEDDNATLKYIAIAKAKIKNTVKQYFQEIKQISQCIDQIKKILTPKISKFVQKKIKQYLEEIKQKKIKKLEEDIKDYTIPILNIKPSTVMDVASVFTNITIPNLSDMFEKAQDMINGTVGFITSIFSAFSADDDSFKNQRQQKKQNLKNQKQQEQKEIQEKQKLVKEANK